MLHRYIGDNTINPESKTLILGTIHPVYTDKFSVDFFYGNEATLWKIFNNAFPDELKNPTCKSCIKQFLECRGISISDVITVCERVPENSPLDRDIVHYEVNSALKKTIRESNIFTIICTSGYGRNNAFRIFYCDILHQIMTKEIIEEIKKTREIILDKAIFGRKIIIKIAFSPSNSALRGIARSKQYKEAKGLHSKTVSDFRVDYYRGLL